MTAATKEHEWSKYIRFFSEQNLGRTTRLGIFERENNVLNDYWIESGLPLEAIDIDAQNERPSIRITVGQFIQEVQNAVKMEFHFSFTGEEDGIDILGSDGKTTVLRFEDPAVAE